MRMPLYSFWEEFLSFPFSFLLVSKSRVSFSREQNQQLCRFWPGSQIRDRELGSGSRIVGWLSLVRTTSQGLKCLDSLGESRLKWGLSAFGKTWRQEKLGGDRGPIIGRFGKPQFWFPLSFSVCHVTQDSLPSSISLRVRYGNAKSMA